MKGLSMLITAEQFIRFSVTSRLDGSRHVVEFPINIGTDYDEIFKAAHSRSDSSIPSVKELGPQLWSDVKRYRKIENELRAKCGLEPLPE